MSEKRVLYNTNGERTEIPAELWELIKALEYATAAKDQTIASLRARVAELEFALGDVLAEASLQDAFCDDEGMDIARRAKALLLDGKPMSHGMTYGELAASFPGSEDKNEKSS